MPKENPYHILLPIGQNCVLFKTSAFKAPHRNSISLLPAPNENSYFAHDHSISVYGS